MVLMLRIISCRARGMVALGLKIIVLHRVFKSHYGCPGFMFPVPIAEETSFG